MKKMLLLAVLSLAVSVLAGSAKKLEVGDRVPEFTVPYATADTIVMQGISSEDLLGTRYVLAPFPAAWSSGCTKEICTFRDAITEFEGLDVEVLPVSADLVFSSHEWAKHLNLSFKLLADQRRELGPALGVYNPQYGMYNRSVFVVGPDGTLEYIDYDYSVQDDTDFEALKSALARLTN
jgi:peroxiredoxin